MHLYKKLMNRKTCQLQPRQMMKKVHSTHLRATLVYFLKIILIEKTYCVYMPPVISDFMLVI